MRTIKSFLAMTAMSAALVAAAPASAVITITNGDITLSDQVCASCANVAFLPSTFDGTGNTGMGETSGGVQVLFTGIEDLEATGPGDAWVGAADGSITSLDVALASGSLFSLMGFNVNEPNGGFAGGPLWDLKITAYYSGGEFSGIFHDFGNNTAFKVASTDSDISHVLIQLLNNDDSVAGENGVPYFYETNNPRDQEPHTGLAYFDGFGQIKIDGVVTSVPGVPEPSTWGMMLLGFGGVGMSVRARKRRTALPVVAS